VGGFVHHRLGSPDWKIVARLSLGSLPAAAVTLWWLARYHHGRLESGVLMDLLAAALLVTAALMVFRQQIIAPLRRLRSAVDPAIRRMRFGQVLVTIAGGAAVGALVTLTSVGAGALIAVMLALVYPLRL